jgi:tRNA(Ile)-lysidine synthase
VPVDGWPADQGKDLNLLLQARDAFPPDGFDKIGVAVSGGGDSIALLHLLHRCAPYAGWAVQAVTVDHDLRPEAAAEAKAVAAFCADLGVPHTTVRWDHVAIEGNVMDAARQARSRLIKDWAHNRGITHVALGHTADDQAETFLMGLARASGVDGLTGLRRIWREDGLYWGRPVLGQTRAELRSYLRRHGIGWVDDPTNDDEKYTRIKARKALAALAPLGITVKELTATANHLAVAQHALREGVRSAVAKHVSPKAGALQVNRAGFDTLPSDLQRRLLLAAIGWLSRAPYPPRGAKQATLLSAMRDGRDATLNGCRFRVNDEFIRISREPKAITTLESPTTALWDNRWRMTGPHAPDLTIRALGDGLRYCPDWRATGLSRDVLMVTPAVWQADLLVAAPLAGFPNGWTAEIHQSLHAFILSH